MITPPCNLRRLLENVLEWAAEPQRTVWVREVLALLSPLVRRSRMVARLLVGRMQLSAWRPT